MKLLQHTKSILSTKMVLIVRNDLKMGKGKIASQCSHAAILCKIHDIKNVRSFVNFNFSEGYQKSLQQNSYLLKAWTLTGQPKIVLKVESLSEIEELYDRAKELGIVAEFVRDAGRTQVFPSFASLSNELI